MLEQADVDIYLFGSILGCRDVINDVDVLVVYECMGDLQKAKRALEGVDSRIPLDITFMHVSEEFELRFVSGQRAVRVLTFCPTMRCT